MNSKVPLPSARTRCYAYGLALEEQNSILDQMTNLIKNMRVIGRKSLLPFQKGIIQSNNALKGLYTALQSRYGSKYILTYRLNQDVLENFFGVIPYKGGLHDHPDQIEFKYRLRSYVIGHNEVVISDAANVETDDTPDSELTEKSLSGKIISSVKANFIIDEAHLQELTELSYDGLQNLAGSICHKLKGTVPDIAVSETQHELATFSWVDHLSEGGLSKPNQKTMAHMQQLQKIFDDNNQEGLLITNNFLKMHMEEAINIECHHKIKKNLFFVTNVF